MSPDRILVTASILSADLGHLQQEVDSIEGLADAIQVDVMDGHFVPNLSFGVPVIKCLKTALPFDIHLMVSNPADRIDEFLAAGAKHITFHSEAVADTKQRKDLLKRIRKGGATAGIAFNPETPIASIDDVIRSVDLVLVMSVHPGFSGQQFIPETIEKIKALRSAHPDLAIQVDGGVDADSGKLCRDAGTTNLVSASYIFGARDRALAVASLRGA